MADYTATTDMTLEQAIANGPMLDGDNLTVDSEAKVTCTETPSILMGNITIENGNFHLDGLNISAGNIINLVGESGSGITVNAQGSLTVTGDWFSIGTTDGTDAQSISLSTYWGSEFEDDIPAIWIETGRRIDYDNSSGTLPEIDDWVYLVSDENVHGRIVEVNEISSYIVVKFLTGSLANDDNIAVKKVVQNNGPDMQVSWTAQVNNASGDILESGVYQEFGNATANNTNHLSQLGDGIGGFAFNHTYQATSLTLASSLVGGFVPPSGCDIRIPNVHISTSDTTNFPLGNTNRPTAIGDWYDLSTGNGGDVNLSICNVGVASLFCAGANVFTASFVGSTGPLGSEDTAAAVSYTNCVVSDDAFGTLYADESAFALNSVVSSGTVTDCYILRARTNNVRFDYEYSNNIIVRNTVVSYGGGSVAAFRGNCYTGYVSSNITFENCAAIGEPTNSRGLVTFEACSGITIENFRASLTQDYSTYSGGGFNALFFQLGPGTRDIYINGIFPLGTGWGAEAIIRFYRASDGKIRCMGMIDDKIDFNNGMQYVIGGQDFCSNIDIARIWTENSGTTNYRFTSYPTTTNSVKITNCSSRYDATFYIRALDDLRITGFHAGSGSLGSYGGLYQINQGSYGRQIHDFFRSSTQGAIVCYLVAPTDKVNNVTIISGNPSFLNDGRLNMANGDSLEIEQDFYTKGHIAFTGSITATRPQANWGTDNWTNITKEFQYDLGNGYNGTWLDATTASNWTSITGSHFFNYDNELGGPFTIGESLSWTGGTGILSSITDNGTTGTMYIIVNSGSTAPTDGQTITGVASSATADVDGAVTEYSDIIEGVRVKYRFTATADTTDMTFFATDTISTLDKQKENFVPIDQDEVTVQVTAQDAATSVAIEGARVLVEAAAGGDLTVGTDILSGTTDVSGIVSKDDFVYTSDQPITIKVRKATSPPYYKAYDGVGVIGSSGILTIASMIGDGS